MRTLISFAALFLSVALVQLSSGALGPLDALAGAASGFSTPEIGALGSAHFAGFFLGCWLAPRLMGSIGHSRTFAAVAAVGAISALMHPVAVDPLFWAVLRVGTGFAVAGAYTVVESWLQAKLVNETRARVFSIYRIVDGGAALAAQGLVALLDPTSYVAYNIIAALCCLCLIPITLTRQTAPPTPAAPRLRPLLAFQLSPVAAFGVVVTGLTTSSFRMVGPVFALERGLDPAEIALFLMAGIAGGLVAQFPVGWLADRYERRSVLVWNSVAALVVCGAITAGVVETGWEVYAASFLFGAAAFPIYSICAAHANDRAAPDQMVELSAALIFIYGIGAIASPLAAAGLIEMFGANALFTYVACAHVALIAFSLYRRTARAAPAEKGRYRYLPRTSFTIGRIFRHRDP